MIISGLVSVTFRQLDPRDIIDLTAKAGLQTIEWGGDVHVPHGDLKVARAVGQMTKDAGLEVASYGSYYKVGEENLSFDSVLETAVELEAPNVRVWAGTKSSDSADEAYRDLVVSDSIRIADLASEAGITISYEYHSGTLTDTSESALDLLQRVDHKSVGIYWQPPVGTATEHCLIGLQNILPWLTNVHVFHWHPTGSDRRALSAGKAAWARYLSTVSSSGRGHFAMLEFVKGDSPENFLQDAAELKRWLEMFNVSKEDKSSITEQA